MEAHCRACGILKYPVAILDKRILKILSFMYEGLFCPQEMESSLLFICSTCRTHLLRYESISCHGRIAKTELVKRASIAVWNNKTNFPYVMNDDGVTPYKYSVSPKHRLNGKFRPAGEPLASNEIVYPNLPPIAAELQQCDNPYDQLESSQASPNIDVNLSDQCTSHHRRSYRRRRTAQQIEEDLNNKILNSSHEGLEIIQTPTMGRGVIVNRTFNAREYVATYTGRLITLTIARELETLRSEILSSYMFYIEGHKLCIDATAEDGSLGRLINHSRRHPNIRPKIKILGNPGNTIPYIYFEAIRDIQPYEELFFNYGDINSDQEWLND